MTFLFYIRKKMSENWKKGHGGREQIYLQTIYKKEDQFYMFNGAEQLIK